MDLEIHTLVKQQVQKIYQPIVFDNLKYQVAYVALIRRELNIYIGTR